ncbi:hypothetical protein C5167_040050 [Papaver somniferum]|uniref:Uncharacterized protein n=1 Tax=Papaver somniferum TaxID=3469 RepID=A0A4Y7IDZ0_PAPSO|nr:hypothetical protein C5167_040050 [Papaver somniferum]
MAFSLHLQTQFCFISSKSLIKTNRLDTSQMNYRLYTKCTLISPKYNPVVVSKQQGNVYYQPTIWDYTFVESLQSNYKGHGYINQIEKLKKEATTMLEKAATPLAQLEMINVIQRLGMKYLFEEEIKEMLVNIYKDKPNGGEIYNLHASALRFMLLRQYGFKVSQDVFAIYMDTNGFKEHLSEDVKGMLSLYEAAHLASEGESILEEAILFTKRKLAEGINNNVELRNQVNRSLEIPLHWRMERSEARWYINEYKDAQDMNRVFLKLAELNFNIYQATHQEDLRNMSRWWRSLGVASKLNFARDRLVGSFLFSIGISAEAKSQRCTEWLTKVMNFVLIIDDIYDVHGSLEELEIFADVWANFIKAMLVEARWCNKGYTPTVKEYLSNGWLSSSGSVFLVHAFFATKQRITTDVLRALEDNHNLLYCASMIFRLSNDLATSSAELERGDVSSSVHCYMREMSSSEEDARLYISGLIMDTWKKMNESIIDTTFDLPFIRIALNLARTAMFFYQYGDGLGVEDDVFTIYMDTNGFKEHLSEDVKGMLSLYEAAHLASEGESILEETILFTKRKLSEGINNNVELRNQVKSSLEIPLHWRMERSEARWSINEYKDAQDMNRVFLKLAELNFNIYQATHQEDLRNMSRWWRSLGVASKLNFARDRLVGSFLFSIGISAEAKSQRCTEWLTKVMNFVLIIDDIYDVHGSLEELEIFADVWENFIKAMLVEARWCNKGYTPTVEEYLSNGWLSSSGSVFLVHAFFATKQRITTDVLRALEDNHNLFGLIMDTWKKMNESIIDTTFDLPFIRIALNLARTAMFFYQYGDGLGVEDGKSKDHLLSILLHIKEDVEADVAAPD